MHDSRRSSSLYSFRDYISTALPTDRTTRNLRRCRDVFFPSQSKICSKFDINEISTFRDFTLRQRQRPIRINIDIFTLLFLSTLFQLYFSIFFRGGMSFLIYYLFMFSFLDL